MTLTRGSTKAISDLHFLELLDAGESGDRPRDQPPSSSHVALANYASRNFVDTVSSRICSRRDKIKRAGSGLLGNVSVAVLQTLPKLRTETPRKICQQNLKSVERRLVCGRTVVNPRRPGYYLPVTTLVEGKPMFIDVAEVLKVYRCSHCGREWSEKKVEEHLES